MLKNKKRNYANSFGCNNSSTFNLSRSNNKLIIGRKWNNIKKVKMQEMQTEQEL